MQTELKDAIIREVQHNKDDFQLHNNTVEAFRAYIYNSKGNYLIGGETVSDFIGDFIKLYRNN